jgi:ribosome-binding protein aMBF1 (putative translation factor)
VVRRGKSRYRDRHRITRIPAPMEKRPSEVREQVATVMRTAQKVLGSREALATRLKVAPYMVSEWIACKSDAPDSAVHEAVQVLLDAMPPPK